MNGERQHCICTHGTERCIADVNPQRVRMAAPLNVINMAGVYPQMREIKLENRSARGRGNARRNRFVSATKAEQAGHAS
jgi:hypothetical protein